MNRNLYFIISLCLFFTTCFRAQGQDIITVAGSGSYGTGLSAGFSGDGGQATNATMGEPWGVAIDPSGNLYFYDADNSRIRKVDTSGYITTFAGGGSSLGDGGSATLAQLSVAKSVMADSHGNIYIADYGHNRVRKINTSGIISTIAGNGTAGYSGDGGQATSAELHFPMALAMDKFGNIYIGENSNETVRKVDTFGIITTYAGNGTPGYSGDGGPATSAQIWFPSFMACDDSNNLYISCSNNFAIRKVTTSGYIYTVAGNGSSGYSGDGGPATNSQLINPDGILFDQVGNLVFGDNRRIRLVDTSGIIHTIAGNGSGGIYGTYTGDYCAATAAGLSQIYGLAIDGNGNIYIADFWNNRIRRTIKNHPPHFVSGRRDSFSVCANSSFNAIDSFLTLQDSDYSQTETWSLIASPLHGFASVSYSATSTGGLLTPTGLYYTPTLGYSGNDSFQVMVADCGGAYDTIEIRITINAGLSHPAPITGPSMVCPTATITLADSISGGSWSSGNTAIGSINSSGVFTGVSVGNVVVSYILTSGCGTGIAKKMVMVGAPVITTIAGNGTAGTTGDGGAATAAELTYVRRFFIDNNQNIYIAVAMGIKKIDTFGIITTVAGNGGALPGFSGDGGPATAAHFNYAENVVKDRAGNMYIADHFNSRIRKINTSGIITTIAGDGSTYYWGDGGPATASELYFPWGLAIDSIGELLFSDQYNNVIRKIDTNGIITTIAGSLTAGFSGDGGPASAASFRSPGDLVFDASGNLLVADWGNFRIRSISPAGIITTIVGTGTSGNAGDGGSATAATIGTAYSLSLDSAGDLYFATGGSGGQTIRMVNTQGIISRIAGNGTAGYTGDGGPPTAAELNTPMGVAVDGKGNIYIADNNNHVVRKISPFAAGLTPIAPHGSICPGATITLTDTASGGLWSSGNTAVATINSSTGVATGVAPGTAIISYSYYLSCGPAFATTTLTINSTPPITGASTLAIGGSIILSDLTTGGTWSSSNTAVATIGSGTGVVTGISAGTVTITYLLSTGCSATTVISVNSCSLPLIITTFGGNGTSGYNGDGIPATSANLNFPYGVATDASGNVIICDYANNRLRKINPSGIISTIAGTGTAGFSGDGGPATSAMINNPYGVAVDGVGNIYFTDFGNIRIRKIDVSGTITTIAGTGSVGFSGDGGPATLANIEFCNVITVDGSGNIYFNDEGRTRKISATGIITTIAGTGILGYSGDGGPGTAALFNFNLGIATDMSGNIYISDFDNCRIRKLDTSGIIRTIAGTGSPGFSGDGGAATAAMIKYPMGLSFDGAGNLYFADEGNFRIRKISTSGIISTIAGTGIEAFSGDGGPALNACFNYPVYLAFDPAGNIYVTDYINQRIRKLALTDRPPIFTGGHSQSLSVYVNTTDSINTLLAVIDSDAGQHETWSVVSGPAHGTLVANFNAVSTDSLLTPTGLYYTPATGYCGTDSFIVRVIDCEGMTDITVVHVAIGMHPITGFTTLSSGATTTLFDASAGGVWSSSNVGVATIGSGTGVVSGVSGGTTIITYLLSTGCSENITINVNSCPLSSFIVTTIGGDGIAGYNSDGIPATSANLNFPYGVATDASGNVIFCDLTNHRVRKINPSGIISTIAGTGSSGFSGDGGQATSAMIANPYGVAVDGVGNIYFTDGGNVRIRKIDASGTITTLAGNGTAGFSGDGGPATLAMLDGVEGIAVDGSGNIYFSDLFRTRKISATGIITTVAGTGIAGYSGDGGPGTAALLNNVRGLATDFSGNVYISDGSNYRIRKLDNSGIITTIAGTGIYGFTGDGGAATAATIFSVGIICDGAGNLYFSDNADARIRKISTSGIISTIAGTGIEAFRGDGGPALDACFNDPLYLACDPAGNIYVTDFVNQRIRKLTLTDTPPLFTGGHSQSLSVYVNTTDSINTLLAVLDSDAGQHETWSVISGPVHGTLVAGYTTLSTGAVLTPTGLYYIPATGFCGTDSFNVKITDCAGKYDTTTIHVTVSNHSVISGTSSFCQGQSTTLVDTVSGGAWSSSNTAVAAFGTVAGLLTGISYGTAIITYSFGLSCQATDTVNVKQIPSLITGTNHLCISLSTLFTDSAAGGTWSNLHSGVALIGSSSGMLTAVAAGTSVITYTLPGGCFASKTVTIFNPLPITGNSGLCPGTTAMLNDSASGGIWTSGNALIATIGSLSGMATGIIPGSLTITYSLGGSCTSHTTLTVNPLPTTITGITSFCVGTSSPLASSPPGGRWNSSSGNVSVDSLTGVATGIARSTDTIYYNLGTGCRVGTPIYIYAIPTPISGPLQICYGLSATLRDSLPGGSWSGSNSSVAIGSVSGLAIGLSPGSATITYTLVTGCTVEKVINIVNSPSPIIAPVACKGLTTTLSDSASGGAWKSVDTAVAIIDSVSGLLTGVRAGTAIISYYLGFGCTASKVVTVNPFAPIIGSTTLCNGLATTWTDAASGGSWTSSSTTTAIIGISTGLLTGMLPGTSLISYSLPTGCVGTKIVTIDSLPPPISGLLHVCPGTTSVLSESDSGAWTSSNLSVITVGSSSGVITGVSLGTSVITFSRFSGCTTTSIARVNPLPSPITGPGNLCEGASITLTDPTIGGYWVADGSGNLSVDSLSGLVSGVNSGTAVVTYKLPTGCYATKILTINPLPAPINGPSGICTGQTVVFSDSVTSGRWTSPGSAGIISTGLLTGSVTGLSTGMARITYTLATGCITTKTILVSPPPLPITGMPAICAGSTTVLADATPGGSWIAPSGSYIISVDSLSGLVTGLYQGTAMVTYSISAGCMATRSITVNAVPNPINGSVNICTGNFTNLSDGTPGGTWSSSGSAISIGSSTGIVTGISAGIAQVSYILSTGCFNTIWITVSPSPGPITGSNNLCTGQNITLSDTTTGGLWGTTGSAVSIGAGTGIVYGLSFGTALVSYTLSGCSATYPVIVNPLPAAISGAANGCEGLTANLNDASAGGSWLSSDTSVLTVGLYTGTITGIATGTAGITYTMPTGCFTTATLEVYPVPSAITGSPALCQGSTNTLHDISPGGNWISSAPSIASVGSSSGIVNGISAGVAFISYNLGYCPAIAAIVVNPLPAPITGPDSLCESGAQVQLYDADTPHGTWTSIYVTVDSFGVVTSFVRGIGIVTYTLPSGCFVTDTLIVNPDPSYISGPALLCLHDSVTYLDATLGGVWSSRGYSTYADVDSVSGVVTGVSSGMAKITYTIPTGCFSTKTVAIDPHPTLISGPSGICVSDTVTYSDSLIGGNWINSNNTLATIGSASGIFTGLAPGNDLITYSFTNICGTSVVTKTIQVNPLPIAGVLYGPSVVCVNATIVLSDSASFGTITWTITNNLASITPSGLSCTITGINQGKDTLFFSSTNSCGTDTVSIPVTINPKPFAGTITGPSLVCPGAQATLSDSSGTGTWNSSNALATVINGVVSGLNTGTDTIIYKVTNSCGTALADFVMNILALPNPGTISGSQNVCPGDSIILTDMVAGGTWQLTNSNAFINTSGVLKGTVAGLDTAIYVVTNICGSSRADYEININPLPNSGAISGADSVCPGDTTSAYTNAVSGGVWGSFDPSKALVSQTGIAVGIAPGIDSITYSVTNSCGTSVSSYGLQVRSAADCKDSLGPLDKVGCSGEGDILIYPNPTRSGEFTLNLFSKNQEEVTIMIVNMLGQKYKKVYTITNYATNIQLSLPAGVYFVSAITAHGKCTEKLVVEVDR